MMFKRQFALLLAVLMLVSMFPAAVLADGDNGDEIAEEVITEELLEEALPEEPVETEIPVEPVEEAPVEELPGEPEAGDTYISMTIVCNPAEATIELRPFDSEPGCDLILPDEAGIYRLAPGAYVLSAECDNCLRLEETLFVTEEDEGRVIEVVLEKLDEEINDEPAAVSISAQPVSGSLVYGETTDIVIETRYEYVYYSFTAGQTAVYTFAASSEVDADYKLYDPSWNQILYSYGYTASFSTSILEGETVYFAVCSYDGVGTVSVDVSSADFAGDSGTCGDSLTWTLDNEGTLTISGSGEMKDFWDDFKAGWYKHKSMISSIIIEDGVTSISDKAFADCTGLTSVTIGADVNSIGKRVFSGSISLAEIAVSEDNTAYCSVNNIIYSKDMTELVVVAPAKTSVEIPYGVTSVGTMAFSGSLITSVSISGSVTSIAYEAFAGCTGLTGLDIPESVISIEGAAFNGCSSLTSIVIPDTVTDIYLGSTFNNCSSLTSVVLPAGVTEISEGAFKGCTGLTSFVIPDGVRTIGYYAFTKCSNLESIVIPGSVLSIYDCAFSNCDSLTDILYKGTEFQWNAIEKGYECIADSTKVTFLCSEGECGDTVYWTLDAEGVLTISGSGAMWDYSIIGDDALTPQWYVARERIDSIVIEEGVTHIGDFAFFESSAASVSIPSTVESIGTGAFYWCSDLSEISIAENNSTFATDGTAIFSKDLKTIVMVCETLEGTYVIPNTVTAIGAYAFEECFNLTGIEIPNSVSEIGEGAFSGCDSINNIVISENVTRIESYTFAWCCSLERIAIPASVTSIGEYAFKDCDSLAEIIYGYTEAAWDAISKDSDYKPESTEVTFLGSKDCCGDYLYWTLDSEGTLTISGIGAMKDYGCGAPWYNSRSAISEVVIEDGVTSIGSYAFLDCDSLTSIVIPDNVTSIRYSAFEDCSSLTNVTIGNGVTSIGVAAFSFSDSLTSVVIGNNVKSIGECAFKMCRKLTDIVIGNGVNSIGKSAFYLCPNLKTLNYLGTVTDWLSISYGDYLSHPNSIATEVLFNGEQVTELVIPDGIIAIGDYSFCNFRSVTSVVIPDSVTSIGSKAFRWCNSLSSIAIGNSVTSIGDYAFCDCSSLTSVNIPDSVTSIGNYAFYGCSNMTSANIPDSVTSIGDCAFYDCSSLTSVNIPDSVTSIGESAFCGCSNLSSVTIGNGVTSIGVLAFGSCSSLTSVNIPDSVTSIGDNAFYICSNLSSVTIGNGVTSVGKFAFGSCSSLTDVVIPDSVTDIGGYAFSGCSALKTVVIPISVSYINDYAFCCCSNLLQIRYMGSENEWLDINMGEECIPTEASVIFNYLSGGICGINTVWALDAAGTLTISGSGEMTFNNLSSSAPWYEYRSMITEVLIPDGVTSICSYSFENCSSLTNVVIPDGVTNIGEAAFYVCSSLENVVIPDSVTSIGEYAFSTCSALTSIVIPDSVTRIGCGAFSYCDSLTSVVIGNGVTIIGDNAFSGCDAITVFFFNGTEDEWSKVEKGSDDEVFDSVICTDTFGFLTQPATPEVVIGEMMSFSVTVMGDVADYRWQYSTDGGSKWSNLSTSNDSAGTASYTVKCTAKNSAYLYRCRVTDASGKKIYSNAVGVVMQAKAAIIVQPVSMIAGKGEYITFHVEATGKSLTYKWQYSKDGGTTWTNFNVANNDSAGTDTYTVLAKTTYDGWRFRCRVTDAGGNIATSRSAQFRYGQQLEITKSTGDIVAKSGAALSYTVTAKGVDLAYKWQYSKNGGESWTNFSSTNESSITPTLQLTAATKYNGWLFRCLVTDALYNKAYTEPAAYYVGNGAVITAQSGDIEAAAGELMLPSVTVIGEHSSRWQYSKNGGTTWTSFSTTNASALTDTLELTAVAKYNGWLIRCKVTAKSTGAVIYSEPISLTVG